VSALQGYTTSGARFVPFADTAATADSALASGNEASGTPWDQVIDKLLGWWREPELLADEDMDAPTMKAIDMAIQTALSFRDNGQPRLNRLVPSVDGGIVFERDEPLGLVRMAILNNGEVELDHFSDGKLLKSECWRWDE
jgi:hypothetical protein